MYWPKFNFKCTNDLKTKLIILNCWKFWRCLYWPTGPQNYAREGKDCSQECKRRWKSIILQWSWSEIGLKRRLKCCQQYPVSILEGPNHVGLVHLWPS